MNTEKTDNELIAEFMGAERREGPRAFNPDQTLVQWIIKGNPYNQHRDDIKHWYQPVELKYHESWDWLMPVVEKIESMDNHSYGFTIDPWGMVIIEYASGYETEIVSFINDDNYPKMQQYYHCVISFIKWYNQQTTL